MKESKKRKEEFLIPIWLDDTVILGIPNTIGHLDLRKISIDKAAEMLLAKLQDNRLPHEIADMNAEFQRNKDYLISLLEHQDVTRFNAFRHDTNDSWLNLKQIDIGGRRIINGKLTRLNLSNIDFKNCNISQSSLHELKMEDVDLSNSLLYLSNLSESYLSQSNLTNTALAHADLYDTNMSKCTMEGTVFAGANLYDAYLSGSHLLRAEFVGSYCDSTRFVECELTHVLFLTCYLHESSFVNSLIFDANFTNANIVDAKFRSAILVGCNKFRDLKCSGADFDGSIIDSKKFTDYLIENGALNVPNPVSNRKDLLDLLNSRGISQPTIDYMFNYRATNF